MSYLCHYGVKGMRWGVIRTDAQLGRTTSFTERKAYSVGAKVNPRELSYKVRKLTNKTNDDVKLLSEYTLNAIHRDGIIPTNKKALKAIESTGIETHAKAVYNNLSKSDIENLKTYTDSARYSRSVNGYLAIGDPKAYAEEARKLKQTLNKNSVDNVTVYRSCNIKFSVDGISKKLNATDEEEMKRLSAPKGEGKILIDLPLANRMLMERAGILPENIEDCGICTYCRNDLFYSYRKAAGRTGRHMAVMILK